VCITHACEFLDLAEEDFDRVLAANLKSMFLCGQAVARAMVQRGVHGAIVYMSSANAVVAIPNQVPYVVSKGGVNQLTKVMALALAPHGIRVNGIGPGTILTELAKKAVLTDDAARRKILSRTLTLREPRKSRPLPRSSRATMRPTSPARPSTRRAGGWRSTTRCRSPEARPRPLAVPGRRTCGAPIRRRPLPIFSGQPAISRQRAPPARGSTRRARADRRSMRSA
jgi:NAD(P)-dependent dehydrogenase (short-subunit alcohol dehydrogenase family)